jgi:hypothetical protein
MICGRGPSVPELVLSFNADWINRNNLRAGWTLQLRGTLSPLSNWKLTRRWKRNSEEEKEKEITANQIWLGPDSNKRLPRVTFLAGDYELWTRTIRHRVGTQFPRGLNRWAWIYWVRGLLVKFYRFVGRAHLLKLKALGLSWKSAPLGLIMMKCHTMQRCLQKGKIHTSYQDSRDREKRKTSSSIMTRDWFEQTPSTVDTRSVFRLIWCRHGPPATESVPCFKVGRINYRHEVSGQLNFPWSNVVWPNHTRNTAGFEFTLTSGNWIQ